MITKNEFNTMFEKLTSNSWEFSKDKKTLEKMEKMYYEKLKEFKIEQINEAFEIIIDDIDQKTMPSLTRIKFELEIMKPYETTNHANVRQNKLGVCKIKQILLSDLASESRKIIDNNSVRNRNRLGVTISQEGKDLLKQCGIKYQKKSRIAKKKTKCEYSCC
jgi:hypothetical protein